MPIYEFKCRDCGDKFEKLVRLGASAEGIKCPSCDSPQVAKQISVCGFIGGGSRADFSAGSSAGSSSCAPTGG